MYIENNVNDNNYLYHKLIDYTYMLSVGWKPMMLITLTWLKLA
jgi:hypothetical protein